MKYIFSICFLINAVFSFAQITIQRTDLGKIGDKVLVAIDTPASAAVTTVSMTAGANKIWNFKTILQPNLFDSFTYLTPDLGAPAQANLLVSSFNGSHYEKLDSVSMNVILDRPANNLNGLTLRVLKLPLLFGNVLRDSMIFYKIGTPTDFNAPLLGTIGYDSVRAEIKAYDTSVCVGWGQLQLPDTTCNALQVKIITVSTTNLFAHSNFTGWVNINSLVNSLPQQRIVEYQWFAKNAKGYMARASLDSTGTYVRSFIYRVRKIEKPELLEISTNSGKRGETISLVLNAKNTHFTQGSSLTFSIKQGTSKLFVNSYNASNDSTILANITISTTSAFGKYDINVFDPIAGTLFLVGAFTVLPPPNLSSIIPSKLPRSGTYPVQIRGLNTHFTNDTNSLFVKFYYQSLESTKIIASNIHPQNDSLLFLDLLIDPNADKGIYTLKVSNVKDGEMQLVDSFEIDKANNLNELTNNQFDWSLYPNPASDELEISKLNFKTNDKIEIFNLEGKLVQTYLINTSMDEISLNISSLKNGKYFLKIQNEDKSISKSFIISR